MGRTTLTLLLVPLLHAGCATALDETCVEVAHVRERWLPPLIDGATRVDQLVARLGAPTMRFEQGAVCGWILQLHEDSTRLELAADGTVPAMFAYGSGSERSARRQRIDRSGELRTVAAVDLQTRALWPVRREAEFHLVVSQRDGIVRQHLLRRVLP